MNPAPIEKNREWESSCLGRGSGCVASERCPAPEQRPWEGKNHAGLPPGRRKRKVRYSFEKEKKEFDHPVGNEVLPKRSGATFAASKKDL